MCAVPVTTLQRKMTFDYNQATYAEDERSPASFNAVRGAHALYEGEVNTPGDALDGSKDRQTCPAASLPDSESRSPDTGCKCTQRTALEAQYEKIEDDAEEQNGVKACDSDHAVPGLA